MKDIFLRYKSLLPVLLLTVYCIPVIISIHRANNFYATTKHFFALAAVILCYSSFFFYRAYFKYILIFTIIFGLFSAIIFTTYTSAYWINVPGLRITFQLSVFWAGLLAYILNFKKSNELIAGLIKSSPSESRRVSNDIWEEEVNKYMERFKGKSTIELSKVVEENKLVASAVEASKRLLEEKVKSTGGS